MAASSKDMTTRLTFRKYTDGDTKYRGFDEDIFNEDTSHKCPTYVHRTPPCQGSCPSGEDIRGWLDIVRGIEKATRRHEHAGIRLSPFDRCQSISEHDGSCLSRTLLGRL